MDGVLDSEQPNVERRDFGSVLTSTWVVNEAIRMTDRGFVARNEIILESLK